MTKGKWLNNIGRIIKRKEADKNGKQQLFLKFERPKDKDGNYRGEDVFPLTINEGDIFQLKRKEYDLEGLVEKGIIDQETANKICEHVKFEVSRGPQDDEQSSKSEKSSKGKPKQDEF